MTDSTTASPCKLTRLPLDLPALTADFPGVAIAPILSDARGSVRFGQYGIDNPLATALKGDVKRGLFFRGAGSLPFGTEIRPVRELIPHLLGLSPAALRPPVAV